MQNQQIEQVVTQSQAISGNPALLALQGRSKDNGWLTFTVALTSGCSVGAFWFQYYPNWFASNWGTSTSSITSQKSGAMYTSTVNPLALATPAAPVPYPPETTRLTSIAQTSITPDSPDTNSDLIPSDVEILEQAKTIAQQTTAFSQTVYSIDDWGLIASRWFRAINLLASVPTTSQHYNVAQQYIETYQQYLEIAQKRASQPITETPLPTTRLRISSGTVCFTKPSISNNTGIELSEVKVVAEGASSYITGCVTNNTNQVLRNLTLTYRATTTNQSNLVEADSEAIKLLTVEPGQTVPFQARISFQPLITSSELDE